MTWSLEQNLDIKEGITLYLKSINKENIFLYVKLFFGIIKLRGLTLKSVFRYIASVQHAGAAIIVMDETIINCVETGKWSKRK